jgi:integrase
MRMAMKVTRAMRSEKTKLTKRLVESVKLNDRDIFVWDAEVPGFGLRVWPSGKRVFIYQYRTKHGHTRRPAIGQYGAITVEQARRIARQWAAEVQQAGDPGGARREARNALSVAQLADRYLAEHARVKKKPRSVTSDETLLRLHILPTIGHRKVPSMTRADVQRLHHGMNETPGAANRTLALLSKMFNLAEIWGLRPDGSNPCRHVEKFKENKLERFLSEAELARLAEVLAEAERTRTELPSALAAIRLLLFTGARLSEILTLRWEHVDMDGQCLRIPDSKTGAKTIYLPAGGLEVLNGLPQGDDNPYVIAGAKPGSHLVNLRKPWGRIRARAKLDDVRLHDLRHSFASMAVAGGLSLPVIGALLGHTQPTTTQRYAHLADDPLKQAANIAGGRIAAAMKLGTRPKSGGEVAS